MSNKPVPFPVLKVGPTPIQPMQKAIGGTLYVNYCGPIDLNTVNAIMATCTQIQQQRKPETIYFTFSSEGGHVSAGITLYNYLRALPVKLVMHNIGSIDSIATVIFLAAKERYAAPGTSFHFHGVASMVPMNQRVTQAWLLETLSHLKEDENKIASIVSGNSKLTAEELRALFFQGETKDLNFALEKGLIQEVRELRIPSNTDLISLKFQSGQPTSQLVR